jgi:cobalt/nickel transport system ATP-binding protein
MAITRFDNIDGCHIESEIPGELIHVDCVSHIYPDGSKGIHKMCFKVYENEIVVLCGPNGSGKSTLIEHLNGLLIPSTGKIAVMGKNIDSGRPDIWKHVGIVFQRSEDQLFAPTVLDDVMFGPLNMGMSIEDAKKAALDALNAVGAGHLEQKMPNYLSGGQKRLISIAGILSMKPRIIALDEPTSDLDPYHSDIIENIIISLKNVYHISVVIATHDLDLAARIADRICIVRGGSIIAEGPPSDIFYDEGLLREAGLKQPKVVRIYNELEEKAKLGCNKKPVRIDELIDCISSSLKFCRQ